MVLDLSCLELLPKALCSQQVLQHDPSTGSVWLAPPLVPVLSLASFRHLWRAWTAPAASVNHATIDSASGLLERFFAVAAVPEVLLYGRRPALKRGLTWVNFDLAGLKNWRVSWTGVARTIGVRRLA